MTYSDLQAVIPTLQVIKYLKLNEELKDTYPTICPVCGTMDGRFIKKEVLARKQRYQCMDGCSEFTYDAKQITANSHQIVYSLVPVVEDSLSLKSLDDTAEKTDVCHDTAFNMRHKLFAYVESTNGAGDLLDEQVEADETYVIVWCTDRKPKRHGECASERGLSNE